MPISPKTFVPTGLVLLLVALGLALGGCGAAPTCTNDLPTWTTKPPSSKDFVYAVAAERSAGGIQRAREKAEMTAREQLAARIQTAVERVAGRLIEDLELDRTDGKVRTYTETVGRQVVAQSLRGSEPEEYADDPCTGLSWVKMRLPMDIYHAALRESTRGSLGVLELSSERLRKAIEVLDRLQANGEADVR